MHHKPWIVRVPREPRSSQGPTWVNGAHALGAIFSEHQAEILRTNWTRSSARGSLVGVLSHEHVDLDSFIR